ncbi:hypothetical protein ACJX0J_023382, partial [Zea mays]
SSCCRVFLDNVEHLTSNKLTLECQNHINLFSLQACISCTPTKMDLLLSHTFASA